MVLKTEKLILVFEFKINSSTQAALKQIVEKGYQDQYRAVILIGANFDTKLRTINEWKTQTE